jgi:uncharacterized SAM-binding protein YcdF (DUF218 family)
MLFAVLFYAWNLVQVIVVAQSANSRSSSEGAILLLGKRAPLGQVDADFQARIDRVQDLLMQSPTRPTVLSGEGSGKSEAHLAWEALRGGQEKASWRLETASRNTRENLDNAKALIAPSAQPTSVVSSRYHLARVKRLAHATGFNIELVAAEDRMDFSATSCAVLLREAVYLSLLSISSR